MGQFCYLICEKEKVRVEAYQSLSYGTVPTNSQNLTDFLDWCKENKHEFRIVDEFFFEDNHDYKDYFEDSGDSHDFDSNDFFNQ